MGSTAVNQYVMQGGVRRDEVLHARADGECGVLCIMEVVAFFGCMWQEKFKG